MLYCVAWYKEEEMSKKYTTCGRKEKCTKISFGRSEDREREKRTF
jgi:hypothetical protein